MRIIIASRADLPISLARLRARNQAAEIDAANLRFSCEGMHAFLEQILRASPKPETIAYFDAQTDGWAANLRLVALAPEEKRNPLATA